MAILTPAPTLRLAPRNESDVGGERGEALSQSATNLSKLPMATDSCLIPRIHFSSHCSSCGQTRPQIAGRAFVSLFFLTDAAKSPLATWVKNPGISTSTGQPLTHWAFLHFKQRFASATA